MRQRGRGQASERKRCPRRSAAPAGASGNAAGLRASLQTYQEELRAQNEALQDAKKAIEDSRDRFANLYDNAPVGYMTLDRNGIIEESNIPAATLLGASRARILHRPLLVFVHKGDRQIFLNHMVRSRNFGSTTRTELRLRRLDGGMVPVELVSTPSSRPRLGGLQYLTTVIDVSERQILEAERRRAEHERVATELREQAARAASDAKDRFLAVLSHELRTPLTPILAAANALKDAAGVPAEVREIIQMIQRNVHMEARLIDDLLDITRITRNKLRLRLEAVDAHAMVRDTASMLAGDVECRGLSLALRLDAAEHWIKADASRFRQVIWNLLSNAIKFTADGGTITIRTSNEGLGLGVQGSVRGPNPLLDPEPPALNPAALLVEVTDTGIGIPPEVLPRLFRPFEQGESDRPGLGLGLSIVKGLVEAHGGNIAVTSAGPGRGAAFTIKLPVAVGSGFSQGSGLGVQGSVREPNSLGPQPPTLKALRILLVEDHPDTARIMAQLLRGEGHGVSIAHAKADALRQINGDFDLVISDIGLPDGTGLELMREIRQRHPVPGIALSGYGADSDLDRSREAGFAEHITKPVDFDRLIEAIARIRANEQSAAQPAPSLSPMAG